MMNKEELIPVPHVIHKHYKGGLYEPLHCAFDVENEIDVIVYRSYTNGTYYTRPLSEWYEVVGNIDEEDKRRFEVL